MADRDGISYPAQYEADVLLRDGSTVHLRPARPEDQARVEELYARLSERSRYLRFHRTVRRIPDEELLGATHPDYSGAFTFVATMGEPSGERIIAVGRYTRLDDRPDHAEVAFTVEDSHQGRGIASQLLDHLASVARDHGIVAFEADVLGENRSMMDVFQASGYPVERRFKYGTFHVAFPIGDSGLAEERAAQREAVAAAASLRVFFEPRSVAVVGASRERGTIGAEVFHNILEGGYTGTVFPVNPDAESVGAVKAYPSVLDIPGDVELAIVIVPAAAVATVAEECARKGVRGLVVISAGFKESGEEGSRREVELLQIARRHGMRIVGPNCMGVLNTSPRARFNGTFAPDFPPSGNVALLSQSGALGIALIDYSRDLNLGLSTFASVGNKADVSGNDLIQYWEQDPDTSVILLYLESFGNPRKFARLAQRIAPRKPIVAVKSGRSSAGSRAAASHTGSLATLDVASDALFKQAGVIRVDTLEELFDVANLLSHQAVPAGRRVAILTNAGGPGIMAADACEANGLEVAVLSDSTRARLAEFLPPQAGLTNPVDMIASAGASDYERALRVLMESESIDSVIAIFIPPLVTQAEDVAAAIRRVAGDAPDKTLLACFMSTKGAPSILASGSDRAVPSYVFPESAALALARVSDYAEWRKQPRGRPPSLDIDAEGVRGVIDAALSRATDSSIWLTAEESSRILELAGIRSATVVFCRSPEEASAAAERMGFPVAVKLASQAITHKSDIGGVVLDLDSPRAVQAAFNTIRGRLEALGRGTEMDGVVVQRMVPGGIEAIVGVTEDRTFGPLMMFGLGGVLVELLKDVSFRIHPLTDVDVRDMVRSIKGYPLLEGWRGAAPGDLQALEELLLRLSILIEGAPEIAEMDLNPVKVLPPAEGCVVVDSRILVRRPGQGASSPTTARYSRARENAT